MPVEANKATARRFVEEVLDGGNIAVEREIFKSGAVRHFPPGDVIVDDSRKAPINPRRSMKTDVHHLFGEGDYVTVHLTHHVTFAGDSRFRTRAGLADVRDKSVEWSAMVILRFEGDKIAEEWVVRDELHVLLQVGAQFHLPS